MKQSLFKRVLEANYKFSGNFLIHRGRLAGFAPKNLFCDWSLGIEAYFERAEIRTLICQTDGLKSTLQTIRKSEYILRSKE